MAPLTLTQRLGKLAASERFDILYGPQRNRIERDLRCKILTLPLEKISHLPDDITYFLVTDSSCGRSYLAVIHPVSVSEI